MTIRGGPLDAVEVITSDQLKENGGDYYLVSGSAVRVSAFEENAKGGRLIRGGRALAVYPVSQEEIDSGRFNVVMGSALPVIDASAIDRAGTGRRIAIPVFDESGALSSGAGAEQSSLLTDLVAYWKLDESSAGAAPVTRVDSVGSNDLTDNGTTASTTGKINDAAQLVQADNTFLSIAANSDVNTGDINFTYAVWINPSEWVNVNVVLCKDNNGVGTREFSLYGWSSLLRWAVFGGGTGNLGEAFIAVPSTGSWHLVIVWYDTDADEIAMQVDNDTPVKDTTLTGPVTVAPTTPLRIGRDSGAGRGFSGAVDEVGFWKRLLTADERSQLWNGGAGTSHPF